MSISENRISYLLEAYSDNKATAEEQQELFDWVIKGNEGPVQEHIEKLVSSYRDKPSDVDWERLYRQIVHEKNLLDIPPVRKMNWMRWAAAAAVMFFLLSSAYYFLLNPNKPDEGKAGLSNVKQPAKDIASPSSVNAVLTLSNGNKVVLDSTGNGMLAVQGAVDVVKLPDGQIVYSGSSKEIQYNELSNPKGSRVINLVLADGTRVWLNAASSLKYPTAFSGKERAVEITGEAFFEVARNTAMPFIVKKGNTSIKVLGTHFNVNAYDDERSLNVTLLEGSVSVMNTTSSKAKIIKPGEQAQIDKKGEIELLGSVDLNEIIAWKNGLFSFKGANIEDIMRQVSRWYDVEVFFEKPVQEKFYAEVSMNTNVSTLLDMLEATKAVKFKIEGRTIRVTPIVSP